MQLDLNSLNPEQREAVTHGDGPLLVVAGPGSGKTRTITSRIAWLISERGVRPWEIVAVTFTNKAAGEMRDRVTAMTGTGDVQVSTFHSFGARFLRREAERLGLRRDFSIYDQGDSQSLMRRLLKERQIAPETLKPGALSHAVSGFKNDAISPEQALQKAITRKDEEIAELYQAYQGALAESGAMDFDDLLLAPLDALQSDSQLLAEWQQRIRHLLIDEYQDTNGAQYSLSVLLAGGHRNICVTGDPDQSIYSWRGANITNILNFERDFPDAKVVKLGQNYRSTRTIVAAADRLVKQNLQRIDRKLYSDNDDGEMIRVFPSSDQEAEASRVSQVVRDWIDDGVAANEIAVFYRTNAQSRSLENALRYSDIPYIVVGAVEFYRRREIVDLLAWLRLVVNPYDEMAFARAIGAPRRGVGDTSAVKIVQAARARGMSIIQAAQDPAVLKDIRGGARKALPEFGALVSRLCDMSTSPVKEILQTLIQATDYFDWCRSDDPGRAADRIENVEELVSDAAGYDVDDEEGAGLPAYLERLALISDTDRNRSDARGVSLMTLHSAKGLEFDAVVVSGVEDGLIPHIRAIHSNIDADMEEERRLLYVGITRARQRLVLTLARTRDQFGRAAFNQPSRFLRELPNELLTYQQGSRYGADSPFPSFDRRAVARETGLHEVEFPSSMRMPAAGGPDDDAADEPWDGAHSGPGLVHLPGGKRKQPTLAPWETHDPPPPKKPSPPPVPWAADLLTGADSAEEPEEDEDSPRRLGGMRTLRRAMPSERRPAKGREDAIVAQPEPAASGEQSVSFRLGDRVRHGMFGVGTIMGLTKGNGGYRARIQFDSWGEKNLALEYARLEVVRR